MEEVKQGEIQLDGIGTDAARDIVQHLNRAIQSFAQKAETISNQEWVQEHYLSELSDLSEHEAADMAKETVDAVAEYNDNLAALNEAAAQGVPKEQWLADKVAKIASGVSVIQHGEYLHNINQTLENGNTQMLRTITTNAGAISRNMNLDGFIAEQYHVNTFNANAALHKSKFFAEVKVPGTGETYGKNSFDIVIRDATNPKATPIHQYQVKYGADAQATIQLLRDHGDVTKYSNQQIVVPEGQEDAVRAAFPGKTVVTKIGGTDKVPISSDSLSKAEAENLRDAVQRKGTLPTTDWNTFQTKELALQVGRNAGMMGLQAAVITTGFSLAEQIIKGEGIDVKNTAALALKTGVDAGLKSAATTAIKICADKGLISLIPKNTPVGIIANIVCVSIENAKILSKIATGELSASQGMDRIGRTTVAMTYGLAWGKAGASIGSAALSWIPVVGPIVGGIVGGTVGYMAGNAFGEQVYSGLKKIGKGVISACKAGWNTIKAARSRLKTKFA